MDEPTPDYPAFVLPSLVRLNAGQLYFGRQALELNDGKLFRSLKLALLPPSSRSSPGPDEFPAGTTPDLLVAIYLTWALGRIKRVLGRDQLPPLSINVAAPMDHVEDIALKERYLHVVHAAWEATFGTDAVPVDQGADYTMLRPRFEDLLERAVPDREIRRFEILPETLAPLVSLSQNPKTRPGFYLMVDMGAGTTEFSVSHVNEQDADHRILCYEDRSIVLGGDQFNDNDEGNKGNTAALLSEETRLTNKLLNVFRAVWYGGFSKEKDAGPAIRRRWKQLTVVLSGGGLRRKTLEVAIDKNPPLDFVFSLERTDYLPGWHEPVDIEFYGGIPGTTYGGLDALPYLAVAHGLSLERQKWPIFYPPKSVEILDAEVKVENPLDHNYLQW